MEDDDVEFGRKEAGQRDGSAQTDGDAHTGDPQRQMTGRTVNKNQIQVNLLMDESNLILLNEWKPEIDGHKGQPDDASRVHGESNVFRLVESGGNFTGDDGVDGAEEDQQDRISERLRNFIEKKPKKLMVGGNWIILFVSRPHVYFDLMIVLPSCRRRLWKRNRRGDCLHASGGRV